MKEYLSLREKIGCVVLAAIVATSMEYGIYKLGHYLEQELPINSQQLAQTQLNTQLKSANRIEYLTKINDKAPVYKGGINVNQSLNN